MNLIAFMAPRVSICIPAYKQLDSLRKSLQSVLLQTYQDFEVIVSDDSPDNSVENLTKEFDFGGKLNYFKNKERLGTPENWNEAMRRAKGEYIKILHHDDYFSTPDSLAQYVSLLDDNTDADFAFSGSIGCNGNGEVQFFHEQKKEQLDLLMADFHNLLGGNIIGAPSATIFKKSLNLFFDKRLKWYVDLDFYIQVLSKNNHFAFSPKFLVNIIQDAAGRVTDECMNNPEIEIFEYLLVYGKYKRVKSWRSKFLMWRIVKNFFKSFNIYSSKDIPRKDELDIGADLIILAIINRIDNYCDLGRQKAGVIKRRVVGGLKVLYRSFFPIESEDNPSGVKNWQVSQAYELNHAIGFMKEPSFQSLFREYCAGTMKASEGYANELILREFFSTEAQDADWKQFVEHIRGRTCLDIGPCVYSPLVTWDVASRCIAIEPLFDKIDSWQRSNLGRSVFESLECYAIGADEFIPSLSNSIDGAIYCRNMIDHTPNWVFVLSNMSNYAASGCKLLLWNDIDHRGSADEGHYDITTDVDTFRRLVEQFGFEIIREFQSKERPELNYGCFAVKK